MPPPPPAPRPPGFPQPKSGVTAEEDAELLEEDDGLVIYCTVCESVACAAMYVSQFLALRCLEHIWFDCDVVYNDT